ncbi:unnamed protein product, partial [Ectocarpus fasciculatus]
SSSSTTTTTTTTTWFPFTTKVDVQESPGRRHQPHSHDPCRRPSLALVPDQIRVPTTTATTCCRCTCWKRCPASQRPRSPPRRREAGGCPKNSDTYQSSTVLNRGRRRSRPLPPPPRRRST